MKIDEFYEKSHICKVENIIRNYLDLNLLYFLPLLREFLIYKEIWSEGGVKNFIEKYKNIPVENQESDHENNSAKDGLSGELEKMMKAISRDRNENTTDINKIKEIITDEKKGINKEEQKFLFSLCLKEESSEGVDVIIEKNRIILEIFNNLILSILKAEYLIFDDYSQKLKKLIEDILNIGNIEHKDKIYELKEQYLDHHFIKSLTTSLYYLIEECRVIKYCLGDPEKKLLPIEMDRHLKVASKYRFEKTKFNFISEELINTFKYAFESIVDMTIIDHNFVANESNIQKLYVCDERIMILEESVRSFYKENIDKKDIQENDSDFFLTENYKREKKEFDKICNIAKIKSLKLLEQIFYRKDIPKEYNFFETFYILSYDEFDKQKVENIKNRFYLSKNGNKYIKIKEFGYIKELDSLIKSNDFIEIDGFKDINEFNNVSREGIFRYILNEKAVRRQKIVGEQIKINNGIMGIKRIIDLNERKIQKNALYNSKFLIDSIEFIHELIEKEVDSSKIKIKSLERAIDTSKFDPIKEKFEILNKLLSYLDDYKRTYSEYCHKRFVPPFQYCYYKYKEDKIDTNIEFSANEIINFYSEEEKFGDCFFFCSYGLIPRNVKYFEDKCNEIKDKYGELDYKYRILLDDNKRFELSDIIRKYDESFDETKKLEDSVKKVNDANRQELEEQKRQTITTLGIFAAFLAFVTTVVGMVKIANNVLQFVLFCLSFILALLLFVYAIRLVYVNNSNNNSNSNNSNGNKTRNNYWNIKYLFKRHKVIILIIIFIFSILYLFPEDKLFEKSSSETQKNEVKFIHDLTIPTDTFMIKIHNIEPKESISNIIPIISGNRSNSNLE